MLSARSSWIARTIWRSLAVKLRSLRGSSSRATCMVSVEAPETMRPLTTQLRDGARPSASGSTPRWLSEALVLVGEQHREEARIDVARASPAAASGLPAWCRAAAAGRRGRPPAWRMRAPRPSGTGPSEATHHATPADDCDNDSARDQRRRRAARRMRAVARNACSARSFRRRHLDRAGGGAAEAVGTVHVLDKACGST